MECAESVVFATKRLPDFLAPGLTDFSLNTGPFPISLLCSGRSAARSGAGEGGGGQRESFAMRVAACQPGRGQTRGGPAVKATLKFISGYVENDLHKKNRGIFRWTCTLIPGIKQARGIPLPLVVVLMALPTAEVHSAPSIADWSLPWWDPFDVRNKGFLLGCTGQDWWCVKSRPSRGQAEEDSVLFPRGKPAAFSKHCPPTPRHPTHQSPSEISSWLEPFKRAKLLFCFTVGSCTLTELFEFLSSFNQLLFFVCHFFPSFLLFDLLINILTDGQRTLTA